MCAGLHSEKGSFCLTTHLSFTGFLALPLAISLAKTQQVQELASQLRHASLQVSSLAQDLQCPLRPLLYDWHSPNPSPAFEIPWLLPKKG